MTEPVDNPAEERDHVRTTTVWIAPSLAEGGVGLRHAERLAAAQGSIDLSMCVLDLP